MSQPTNDRPVPTPQEKQEAKKFYDLHIRDKQQRSEESDFLNHLAFAFAARRVTARTEGAEAMRQAAALTIATCGYGVLTRKQWREVSEIIRQLPVTPEGDTASPDERDEDTGEETQT